MNQLTIAFSTISPVTLLEIEMGKDGKTLRGVVRVKNVAFEKWVAVRFTLDHWATVSEVSAEHQESMGSTSDRFAFTIKLQDLLARIEEKTMFISVRYTAGGREIWDNNGGQNYEVRFFKEKPAAAPAVAKASSRVKGVGTGGPGVPQRQSQTWSVVNAGQASDRMADLRRELDRLVHDDSEPAQAIATRQFTEGSPSALSGRYDFGASLKAFGANGQRGTQSPNLDAFVPLNRSPPKSQASYQQLSPAPASPKKLPPTSYSHFGVSGNPQNPSPNPRPEPTPDFGQSSINTGYAYSPSLGLHAYPPTSPLSGRPPSPPAEAELAANLYKSYQQYLPLNGGKQPSQLSPQISSVHTRFNSFPGASPISSPPLQPTSFSPLVPPAFRAGRNADSPMISPAMSPAPSPSGSPPRRSSPPLYPAGLKEPGLWSPASSSAASSTVQGSEGTAETSSPASEPPSSVPESPSQGFQAGLSSSPNNDFTTFLDKYCFNTQSTTSSLGLSGPEGYGTPLAGDYLPPRRLTPTQERYNRSAQGGMAAASCAAAYSSGSPAPSPSPRSPARARSSPSARPCPSPQPTCQVPPWAQTP